MVGLVDSSLSRSRWAGEDYADRFWLAHWGSIAYGPPSVQGGSGFGLTRYLALSSLRYQGFRGIKNRNGLRRHYVKPILKSKGGPYIILALKSS